MSTNEFCLGTKNNISSVPHSQQPNRHWDVAHIDRAQMSRCVALLLISQACLVSSTFAQDRGGTATEGPRSRLDPYYRSIEFGRKQIKDVSAGSFVDLDFEEVANYQRLQIHERLAFLLQDDVHPQPRSKAPPRSWMKGEISREEAAAAENRPALHHLKPGRMTVRVFAAYESSQCDLIEYRWQHDGLHLRALVARQVVRMDLDLAEVEESARAEGETTTGYLRRLLPKLIRLKGETKTTPPLSYKAQIPLPDDLREGVEFSSDPEQLINSMDFYRWFQRIDGFVESGKLALLFYMKPGQKPYFRDCSKWFDDDFRALVHQKAREQSKLPPTPGPESNE